MRFIDCTTNIVFSVRSPYIFVYAVRNDCFNFEKIKINSNILHAEISETNNLTIAFHINATYKI